MNCLSVREHRLHRFRHHIHVRLRVHPREIESYWYPVWLTYPAGLLEGSRVLDAPPHHVSAEETIKIAKDYEFLVLFTSTVGWEGDQRLAEAISLSSIRSTGLGIFKRQELPHEKPVRGRPLSSNPQGSNRP